MLALCSIHNMHNARYNARLICAGLTKERRCGQYSVTNCRCDVYAFNLRRSMRRPSMIDVSTFEDRCVDFRRSMIDVSTFEDRRSMCRLSKIAVSTFGDRCVDLRRSMVTGRCVDLRKSMIDVSIIEDRCANIDGRCEIMLLYLLKTLIL